MEKPQRTRLIKCDSIGQIVYSLAVIVLQVYVHYDEIESYIEYKKQANDPRYGLQWSEEPATFCLMMTMLSLTMLPLLMYSTLVRTGNLVNDYISLGDTDLSRLLSPRSLFLERLEKAVSQRNQPSCWRILKYYCIPSCQALHFISAFLLLIPQSFLNAEKIRNSALSFDYYWISDLHTLFNVKDPGTLTVIRQESEVLRFPIVSINYIIATLFISIYTSSVFWRTTKSFSFLVAIFDVAISCCFLILNSTLSVAMATNSDIPKLYSNWQCGTMFIAGFLSFLVCRSLVFEFGLQRYIVNQRLFTQMLDEIKVPSISTGILRNSREFKDRIRNHLQSHWLNVIGFLTWLVEAGCLIPLACHLVTMYWATTKLFFILGFISITSILVAWFSVWMLLSIKHNWIFKVGTTMNVLRQENTPPEPVYTCFQTNKSSLDQERRLSFENHGDTYIEDNKWEKSDLYQLFKLPPDYNSGRIPSVSSIQSNFGNDHSHQVYQTMQGQQNLGSLRNGIAENRLLADRSGRVSVKSPLARVQNTTPRNIILHNNSQSDSAYQSSRTKNYSQDSLRSVTFAHRRRNVYDFSDFSRADNIPQTNYETSSHNGIYSTKEMVADDNTDISTDFSDQNTNSSGTDIKINHTLRYFPIPYLHENGLKDDHNGEMYLQQTGV